MTDITSRVQTTVHYADTAAGPYTEVVGAQVDTVAFACAPAVDSAQFTYPYGWVEGAQRSSIDFRDRFIRIRLAWDNGSIFSWYGYCHQVENRLQRTQVVAGVEIPTGDVVCQCASRAKQMGERRILGSFTREGFVYRPLPFNLPARDRNALLIGNRAAAKIGSDDYYTIDAAGGKSFTALDAVEHLLAVWTYETGIETTLLGQYSALAYYSYHWNPAGKTYWQLLTEIISPGRGFVLISAQNHDGSLSFTVTTASGTNITLDDYSILPASDYQIDTVNIAESEVVQPPVLHRLPAAHSIIVRGEPLRLCLTLGYTRLNLVAGWTAAQESAYASASAEERRSDAYKDLFQRFTIPAEWDGRSYVSGAYRKTLPRIDPFTGRCDLDFPDSGYAFLSQTAYLDDTVLDKDIPIYRRNDYQTRPIAAWVYDGAAYLDITAPGAGAQGVNISPLDDCMGVRIQAPAAPYYGKNHSSVGGEKYDWQELLFTVAFDTNDVARVQKTISAPPAGGIARVRTLDIEDLHVWYVLPATVTDAFGGTTVGTGGEYARDDSDTLRYIAEIAAFWYGQDRTQFDVAWNYAPDLMYLGHLIVQSEIAGNIVPTGTVVTSVTYRFQGGKDGSEVQTCTWATEWFDLNLEAIFASRKGGRGGRRRGHSPNNYPAALAYPGAAAGGGGSMIEVTSGPTGGVYTGKLYGNGWAAAATDTGINIKATALHASTPLPAGFRSSTATLGADGTYWVDVPRIIG